MITVTYAGGDRLGITVRDHQLYADQPKGDGGADTAPTPSELFVASLAACVAFYAERFLRRNGLRTDGLEVSCNYSWAENPHRVGEIRLVVEAPGLPAAKREAFSRVISHCTVHNSLEQPPVIRLQVDAATTAAA